MSMTRPAENRQPTRSKRLRVAFVDTGPAPQTRDQALLAWYDRACARMDALPAAERAELEARAERIIQEAAHAAD